ncbi:hypothetical protein Hypma_001764 [Hypsizygus marmoreus]|uniref:Uncharacterized protein n=1 Tax=Hypsizygus marmoreus TaxID=39966 RepID=A0A369J5C0_HYPMA|nr:hypothetical protein Hypma_001764 [Hypsizygus marmoreus]
MPLAYATSLSNSNDVFRCTPAWLRFNVCSFLGKDIIAGSRGPAAHCLTLRLTHSGSLNPLLFDCFHATRSRLIPSSIVLVSVPFHSPGISVPRTMAEYIFNRMRSRSCRGPIEKYIPSILPSAPFGSTANGWIAVAESPSFEGVIFLTSRDRPFIPLNLRLNVAGVLHPFIRRLKTFCVDTLELDLITPGHCGPSSRMMNLYHAFHDIQFLDTRPAAITHDILSHLARLPTLVELGIEIGEFSQCLDLLHHPSFNKLQYLTITQCDRAGDWDSRPLFQILHQHISPALLHVFDQAMGTTPPATLTKFLLSVASCPELVDAPLRSDASHLSPYAEYGPIIHRPIFAGLMYVCTLPKCRKTQEIATGFSVSGSLVLSVVFRCCWCGIGVG